MGKLRAVPFANAAHARDFRGKISMPSVCNRPVRTLYFWKVFIFLSSTKGELLTGNQEFTGTTQIVHFSVAKYSTPATANQCLPQF